MAECERGRKGRDEMRRHHSGEKCKRGMTACKITTRKSRESVFGGGGGRM